LKDDKAKMLAAQVWRRHHRAPQLAPAYAEAEWRTTNIGRLMLMAFKNFENSLLASLQKEGFPDIRPAHLSVLRQMDIAGTRIIDIAERAGTTKQAMGQLVAECVKQKLVVLSVDPTDRRAKIVAFTERGLALIQVAHHIVVELEDHYRKEVGKRRYQVMADALAAVAALQTRPDDTKGAGGEQQKRRSKPIPVAQR
jgi:DNA-binding MarR family transcriptional regulator